MEHDDAIRVLVASEDKALHIHVGAHAITERLLAVDAVPVEVRTLRPARIAHSVTSFVRAREQIHANGRRMIFTRRRGQALHPTPYAPLATSTCKVDQLTKLNFARSSATNSKYTAGGGGRTSRRHEGSCRFQRTCRQDHRAIPSARRTFRCQAQRVRYCPRRCSPPASASARCHCHALAKKDEHCIWPEAWLHQFAIGAQQI
mmetsp:Transcript_76583/g.212742  ORF Transcript_76583/g.212742 Transcript_76583/m.212742 type:complete len:203 (-) Transcript_76583:822-1430(-)